MINTFAGVVLIFLASLWYFHRRLRRLRTNMQLRGLKLARYLADLLIHVQEHKSLLAQILHADTRALERCQWERKKISSSLGACRQLMETRAELSSHLERLNAIEKLWQQITDRTGLDFNAEESLFLHGQMTGQLRKFAAELGDSNALFWMEPNSLIKLVLQAQPSLALYLIQARDVATGISASHQLTPFVHDQLDFLIQHIRLQLDEISPLCTASGQPDAAIAQHYSNCRAACEHLSALIENNLLTENPDFDNALVAEAARHAADQALQITHEAICLLETRLLHSSASPLQRSKASRQHKTDSQAPAKTWLQRAGKPGAL